MSVELGTAYLSILPETSKIAPGVRRALGDTERQGTAAGRSMGSRMAGAIGKTLKVGAVAAGAAVTGVLGTALVKGFGRLTAIENARASLSGLGHDAKSVEAIMGNALDAVKGTAFGMGDAAQVAASMVAAGIKPGKDLENTLRLVGDAATIAGTDMSSMGAIFGKVAASNKVQMDVINQLHDAGVPALQLLAQQMGVTAEEASAMASAGEVDFATFSAAMQSGLGGAALKSGETLQGSLANLNAALGRVGAGFLSGVFPMIAPALQGLTERMGPLEKKAAELGEAFSRKLADGIRAVQPFLAQIPALIDSARPAFDAIVSAVGNMIDRLAEAGPSIGSSIGSIASALGPLAELAATGAVTAIVIGIEALGIAAQVVAAAIAPLAAWAESSPGSFRAVAGAIAGVTAAWYLYRGAMAAVLAITTAYRSVLAAIAAYKQAYALATYGAAGAQSSFGMAVAASLGWLKRQAAALLTSTVSLVRNAAAWTATRVAMIAGAAATGAMTAAQWLLNAAMSANPIGLIIVAIVALVAAIVILWKRSATFRKIVIGTWNAIKKATLATFKVIGDFIKKTWDGIKNVISTAIKVVKTVITTYLSAIKTVWTTIWNVVRSVVVGVWNGIKAAITTAFKIVKTVITTYLGAIKTVWTTIWGAIRTVVSSVWGRIRSVISGALGAIRGGVSNALGAVRGAFSSVFNGVVGTVSGTLNRVVSVITGIPGRIRAVGSAMKTAGKAIIDKLLSGIANAGGFVANIAGNIWNAVKRTLNTGIRAINNALDFTINLPLGIGSFRINAPDIPQFAKGTNYAPGGAALVGERGPEIVNLPRGSQVIPNNRIMGELREIESGASDGSDAAVGAIAAALASMRIGVTVAPNARQQAELYINGQRYALQIA